MSPPPRIFVAGASRGIGAAVVEQALSLGWTVHAMARSPMTAFGSHPRLMPVLGDCREPTLLAEGVMGCDAAVNTIGTGPAWSQVTLFSAHTSALLRAMWGANVRRLIAVTGLGAGDSRGHGGFLYDRIVYPLALAQVYADKDRQEVLIRQSGLQWTILRPGMLTNGPATGRVTALTAPGTYRFGRIARADVAATILACIAEGRHVGAAPVLVS